MNVPLYRDPTLERAQRLEVEARKCETCSRSCRKGVSVTCRTGLRFPACLSDPVHGFKLVVE